MELHNVQLKASKHFKIDINASTVPKIADDSIYEEGAKAINDVFWTTLPTGTYDALLEIMLENTIMSKEKWIEFIHKVYNKKFKEQ
jgi:hypothetical protein